MVELKDVNAGLIAGLPDLGPVVMVNLLPLRDRDAYRRYSELAMPLIKARGGTVIWAGNGEAVGQRNSSLHHAVGLSFSRPAPWIWADGFQSISSANRRSSRDPKSHPPS